MLDVFRTLPGLLHDIEGAEMIREAIVFAAWRRVAGEGLSDHTVPLKLENGRLTVAVSNLTWQRHLKDLLKQMIFKLNAAVGEPVVNYIDLQIDDAAVQAHRSRATDRQLDLSDAQNQITPELAMAAETIEDDDLRRQFLLAAGNCLERRRAHRDNSTAR